LVASDRREIAEPAQGQSRARSRRLLDFVAVAFAGRAWWVAEAEGMPRSWGKIGGAADFFPRSPACSRSRSDPPCAGLHTFRVLLEIALVAAGGTLAEAAWQGGRGMSQRSDLAAIGRETAAWGFGGSAELAGIRRSAVGRRVAPAASRTGGSPLAVF